MIDFRSPGFLRRVLWLDATTCVATGALMSLGATPLASLLHLPTALLIYSGLSLFPVAAFIAFVASRSTIPAAGVWLVVAGNAAWSLTSLALLTDQRISPNALGIAFVLIQAAVVALLAELEYTGLKASTANSVN
jgi:hypothetical protein